MTIKQKKENGKLVVFIEGRVDTTSSPVLSEYLQKELNGVKELELDFSDVEYISSAGLRVLLGAAQQMNGKGEMTLIHVSEAIREIFDVTGFIQVFNIQ